MSAIDIGNLPVTTVLYLEDLMKSKIIVNHLKLSAQQNKQVLYTLKELGISMCTKLIKNNESTNSLLKVFQQEFEKECSPPKSKFVITSKFTSDILTNESIVKDFNIADLKLAGMEAMEIQSMNKELQEKQKSTGIAEFTDGIYTKNMIILRKYFTVLE